MIHLMGSPKNISKNSFAIDQVFEDISVTTENQCEGHKTNDFQYLTGPVTLSAEKLEKISRKNQEQWCKILKAFEPINNTLKETPKSQSSSRRRLHKLYTMCNSMQNSSRTNNKKQTVVYRNRNKCQTTASVKPSFQKKVKNPKKETPFSSSIDSSDRESKAITWKSTKYLNPENDLDAFIKLIERDFRKTKKTCQKKTRAGSYSAFYKSTSCRSRADLGFMNHEQRMRIRNAMSGNVTGIKISYGVCITTLKEGNEPPRCFVIDELMQPIKVGSSLMHFVDSNNYYMVNGMKTFIQPNRIVNQN